MKKTISFIAILSLVSSLVVPFFGTANANLETKKVRVVVTYPESNATLGVDAGALVHEPSSGILFRFALKNSSNTTLCMEEKAIPVVNGIMTYELGSQYSININGITTGCNMESLISNNDYKVIVTGDLNGNNSFADSIDYTSEEAVWTEGASQQFEDSFLDSKTLDIQKNIGTGSSGSGSVANITYNQSATQLSNALIADKNLTKTFDLDKDGATEVLSKDTTSSADGVIFYVNKTNGNYESIYSSNKITLQETQNIFAVGKNNNFLLHGSLSSTSTVTNLSVTLISMSNGAVSSQSQTLIEFARGDYFIINFGGEDLMFIYNPITRLYEQQITVNYGISSNLYKNVTDPSWIGTPFADQNVEYYGGNVREADVNGNIITDIDGIIPTDLNKDGKLDYITYKNTTGGKALFSGYLNVSPGIDKKIFDSILGDGISAGTSLVDNGYDHGGTDINEIFITNGNIKDIYKINGNWEINQTGVGTSNTVTLISSFESTFYAILANDGGTINVDETFLNIGSDGFKENNPANIDNKYLLIGNYKVNKDGYDYYDYSLKYYNGSIFEDVLLKGTLNAWKGIGNKMGFTKVPNSDFNIFYLDQSTEKSKGKTDKTNIYYIYNNEVVPILTNVLVNSADNQLGNTLKNIFGNSDNGCSYHTGRGGYCDGTYNYEQRHLVHPLFKEFVNGDYHPNTSFGYYPYNYDTDGVGNEGFDYLSDNMTFTSFSGSTDGFISIDSRNMENPESFSDYNLVYNEYSPKDSGYIDAFGYNLVFRNVYLDEIYLQTDTSSSRNYRGRGVRYTIYDELGNNIDTDYLSVGTSTYNAQRTQRYDKEGRFFPYLKIVFSGAASGSRYFKGKATVREQSTPKIMIPVVNNQVNTFLKGVKLSDSNPLNTFVKDETEDFGREGKYNWLGAYNIDLNSTSTEDKNLLYNYIVSTSSGNTISSNDFMNNYANLYITDLIYKQDNSFDNFIITGNNIVNLEENIFFDTVTHEIYNDHTEQFRYSSGQVEKLTPTEVTKYGYRYHVNDGQGNNMCTEINNYPNGNCVGTWESDNWLPPEPYRSNTAGWSNDGRNRSGAYGSILVIEDTWQPFVY